MTTNGLIVLDLVLSVLAAAGWLAAGALAAGSTSSGASRARLALIAAGAAIVASLTRAATVVALTGAGWWFVQEKVTLTLPLLLLAGLGASLVGARQLLAASRGGPAPSKGAVLALLTAGYASVAGPFVTLLNGYPATWTVALLTLAAVGGCAVLTARVLNLSGLRTPAVASLAAAVLGSGLGVIAPSDMDTGGGPTTVASNPVLVSSLRGPDAPEPTGTVRRFTFTAQTATIRLPSGRTVPAWTFNGQVPGPAITATQGDLIEVTLRNADIAEGVTLHWHGYDVPAAEDGVPGLTQDAVLPGQEYVYRFLADQVGTYWYHTHEVSDRGVKMGLYGTLVVSPRGPRTGTDLVLPVHSLGGATVVADTDGTVAETVAPGTPVRLRLINTDDVPRVFAVAGTAFRLLAVDGADLNDPGELSRTLLRLPAGGRYDVAFTMPDQAVSLVLTGERTLVTLNPQAESKPLATADGGWPVLDLLHYGAPANLPFTVDAAFDRRFSLVLDQGLALVNGGPAYAYTINGRAFPDVPGMVVATGDLVLMTVVNRGRVTHPWHLHGHRVLVLARDGQRPQGTPLWLDTFDVQPGEVWQVGFRADNPGLWMNHCHNLSHAEQGMVMHLAYQGVASAFHGGHGG